MQGQVLRLGAGGRLLDLLRGRRIEGFERSFKLSPGLVLGDRFLAGIHKEDLPPQALLSICERMGMADASIEAVRANAEAANAFHFGYEGGGDPSAESPGVFKVYLEFATRLGRPGNALLYLAWKWRVDQPAAGTLARYECFGGLPVEGILRRIGRLHEGPQADGLRASIGGLFELASGRLASPPMYLEVREEGTPRASFDINLHDAGLTLPELVPWLSRVRDRLAVPPEDFDTARAAAGEATLGHVSGGLGRDGTEFLTVYYAAEPPWTS